MTITTTRLALPITLGDDFPYRKEFFKQLQIFVQNDSTWHGQFLAAWLTPKETLLQMEAVRCDYCSVEEMWECYGEDNFDENPAVEIGKDNHITAVEKFLARRSSFIEMVPDCWAQIVLSSRPGDVTADGREVAK